MVTSHNHPVDGAFQWQEAAFYNDYFLFLTPFSGSHLNWSIKMKVRTVRGWVFKPDLHLDKLLFSLPVKFE